jgi:HAD superfamily hydrolase (TIGR01450 family)
MIDLSGKKLFLFDMDGVLLKGKEEPIKIGGTKIIRALRHRKKRIFILTNNSTDTTETIHGTLSRLKIPVTKQEILSSARLTAEYIAAKKPNASYHLVGESGFDQELRRLGLKRSLGKTADFVAIGLDRKLTYQKLDAAAKVASRGARIVATHAARLYMARNGPAIAVGPIAKAIEAASGKRAVAIGKPSPLMFRIALNKAGVSKEEAIMVGDQLETDVLGSSRAGIQCILVSSGVDHPGTSGEYVAAIGNVDDLVNFL